MTPKEFAIKYLNSVSFDCNHCIQIGLNGKCNGEIKNSSNCTKVKKQILKMIEEE